MKRLIKFSWLPASWGLVGDAYDVAEAHYTLSDEPLERRLAEIRYKDEPDALAQHRLVLDHKYGRIDAYGYDIKLNSLKNKADPVALAEARLDIEVNYGHQTVYAADHIKLKNRYPGAGLDYELAVLDIDYAHGKLTKNQRDKQQATLRNDPWVAFVDSGFDPEQGIDGVFFELDWNLQWVDYLRLHGFVGRTDEQIVED